VLVLARCRAYLAVAGGIDVPTVLGSRATYVRAAIGGYEGRALRAGDLLAVGAATGAHLHHAVDVRGLDLQRATVRYVAGPHHALLTDEARRLLATAPFRLAPGSDRMGLRFEGASLALRAPVEPLSAGVAMGTMQLPPGGAPIVLMADRQTTGGYPCIGGVAAVDLPALAQLRPGEAVRFEEVSLEAAEALYLVRERELDRIRRLLAMPP